MDNWSLSAQLAVVFGSTAYLVGIIVILTVKTMDMGGYDDFYGKLLRSRFGIYRGNTIYLSIVVLEALFWPFYILGKYIIGMVQGK